MKSAVTISVIIPCYNSEMTIKACVESVLAQTVNVNEIIVVDDGSSDGSIPIIKEVFKNSIEDIKFILQEQKNQGPSVARNKGVKLSTSNYVAFLDSDDEWHLDHIRKVKEFLEKNFEYKIVATKYLSGPVKFSGEITFEKLLLKNYLLTPCVVLNKDCFWEFEGFNEKMKYVEDYYLWLKITFKNKVYLLDYIGAQNIEYKRPFGAKGLSSNMVAMHKGVLYCYESLCSKKMINYKTYLVLKNIEKIKYFRRKLLTFIHI
jgi:glycosyltransferase involved in cell wall biosynthesis